MDWILLIIAFLLVGAMVILLWPIVLRLHWEKRRRSLTLNWLGVSIGLDLNAKTRRTRLFGIALSEKSLRPDKPADKTKAQEPRTTKVKAKKRADVKLRLGDLWSWRVLIRRLILRTIRYGVRLVKTPRLVFAKIDAVYGTGDAATTGMSYGWLSAFRGAFATRGRSKWNVNISPDFEERRFDGNVYMKWRLVPIVPAWETVRFVAGMPYRELYRVWRTIRERKRECPTT